MIVNPTKDAARVILDAEWQKLWDDNIASLSKIEWEVLTFAAKPGRHCGAFDIMTEITKHQRAARLAAIRRLLTLGLLRNVQGRGFGTISNEGFRAITERVHRLAP